MDPVELRALFDRQLRIDPPPIPGYRLERTPSVVRFVGRSDSTIVYTSPASVHFDALIRDQVATVWSPGTVLEWKIYSHDGLEELGRRLTEHGFRPKPHETLMAFDLREAVPTGRPPSTIRVQRVADAPGLADYVEVERIVFGRSHDEPAGRATEIPSSPLAALYVAYVDGRPAGAGRVVVEEDRPFAGIFGGGTIHEFRGRGVYLELVRARADFARRAGVRYLLVEAIDTTSRPILARVGFVPIAGVDAWVLGPDPPGARPDQGSPAGGAGPA